MSFSNNHVCEYSDVLVALHKSEISRDDIKLWDRLILNQKSIRDFYSKLFLNVHIDEKEGFAFLKSLNQSNVGDDDNEHPRLMRRLELNKPTTLLLFVLRESLFNFDNTQQDSLAHVLSRKEMREMMAPYYELQTDDVKFIQWTNNAIENVTNLGFIKLLKETESNQELQLFEVKRILNARIPAEQLKNLKQIFSNTGAHDLDDNEAQTENV